MKIIVIGILLILMTNVVWADLYVVIDGDPKGVVSVKKKYLSDWEKDYTMIKVGEEYRGKQRYEIKYDGNKVRLAIQSEINDYLAQKEVEKEARRKTDAMDILGISQTNLDKLKALTP